MVKFFEFFEMFNPPEEAINFDSFIRFPLLLFKLVLYDFDPLPANPTVCERIKHIAKMSFSLMCLLGLILAETSMCMFPFLTAENFEKASENIPDTATGVLFTLRAFVSIRFRKDLWKVFADLREVFASHSGENSKHKIKQYLDGYHFLMKIYGGTYTLLFLPVVFPTFSYLMSGSMEMPINYWFPFEPFTPRNFPIVLAWTDIFVWIFLAYMLSVDSLLYALITALTMEFDILTTEFMELEIVPEDRRMDKLKSLIDRHNKLFGIADSLQNIFEVIFLVSFVLSSLVMCYVTFIISNASDVASYSLYVPYLFVICCQILLLCFYGQKMLDSSSAVADGIFNCNWEEFNDVALSKHLILVIARAQRPKRLTGMGFFTVRIASFTSVS